MRIWHELLIPYLCQKHLCAMWREGLGCYKIITENKSGYRNHPAVKEFEYNIGHLEYRLILVRNEMIKRGYHPKKLPFVDDFSGSKYNVFLLNNLYNNRYKEWQSLEQQIEVLKTKGCQCNIKAL